MKRRLAAFLLLSFLVPVSFAATKWDRYKPNTLHGMVDNILRTVDKQPGLMSGFANDSASIVHVIYLGKRRPVPPGRAQTYAMCGTVSGFDHDLSKTFTQEILVREEEKDYWLPVQDVSIPDYDIELKANDAVSLYVILVGIGHEADGGVAPFFLVNEFRKN